MNEQQLTTILSSAAVVAVLLALITNINNSARAEMASLFAQMGARIDGTNQRIEDMRHLWRAELGRVEDDVSNLRDEMRLGFQHLNQRFDDMPALWRAELGRVED
ncbi:MAG: hypothetical protein H7039_17410 [Bryobacteraceae bacterium]|nr:hypothetical protein [Bryobacteraceae bacterium]